MDDSIFRQYDIRGIVGRELPLEEVPRLGRAIAAYFAEQDPSMKTVAVGMDGREHSLAIKDALCGALQESGLDVLFIGVCTY